MKKLKVKIFFTNLSRIIMSVLFINVFELANKVLALVELDPTSTLMDVGLTCYIKGPEEEPSLISQYKVFILLVPIAVLIAGIVLFIKHKKNKKTDGDKNDKKD